MGQGMKDYLVSIKSMHHDHDHMDLEAHHVMLSFLSLHSYFIILPLPFLCSPLMA